MDLSRLKKVLAGASVAAIMLSTVSSAIAAYSDVASGVWYEAAVKSFTDAGYLDATQTKFRPMDTANRAEFTKLLVELNGGVLSTPPAVPSFDDAKASDWYYKYMEEAGKEGWVKGDGSCYGSHPCYARPSANINRAEAAALIVRAFGLESTGDAPQFVDNPSGQWYTQALQIAADHCVVQGDSTTGRARPSDAMNRAEMVVMLTRVDQGLTYGKDCGGAAQTSTPSISSAVAVASTKVDVTFNVKVDKTAGETIANWAIAGATVSTASLVNDKTVELVLASALTANQSYTVTASNVKTSEGKVFSDSAKFNGYSALPQGNGTLEVSMSSKNPAADTIPQGAHGVTMLSLDLTASCDDSVTIENMTVLHEGFGDKSDIAGVYVTMDGGRISRTRTIASSDQTVDLRFTTPLVVPACKTVSVDIAADFNVGASLAGAEHNMALELATDFVSNAKTVKGNFPVRGNTFKLAAVHSGELDVAYRSVTPSKLQVGDKGKLLGKLELSTDSTEDQTLYTMTLKQEGSVSDGDITNIQIRRTDGTALTNTAAQFKGKFATLTFNPPFTILQGDKVTLQIVGDVVAGAGNDSTIDFDEASDIFAVGSLYGYGTNGQLYGSKVVTGYGTTTASAVTIDAGQFTMETNGPTSQTYTKDQNDAILANLNFTTGGDTVDVQKLFIGLVAHTSTGVAIPTVSGLVQNVAIRNVATGRAIEGTPATLANNSANGYQIYEFDDFTVNGKETYQFKVDFVDNGTGTHPGNGDQFYVVVVTSPSGQTPALTSTLNGLIGATSIYDLQSEGLSTGDKINDVRPGTDLVSTTHLIAEAGLTVGVQSLATSDTAVANAKNVRLMRFDMRAGEAKSILLTKVTVSSADGTSTLKNGTNYALWADTDGNGQVDTIVDSGEAATGTVGSSNWTATFSSFTNGGFVIDKAKDVTFEVHADIAGSTSGNLQLSFATGSTTVANYIEAETVDRGSSLSGIKTLSAAGTAAAGNACTTNCNIIVTSGTTPVISLVNQGSLKVTADTTKNLSAHQLLGGTTSNDEILRLKFQSSNEPIDVTDIQLTSSGGTAPSLDWVELYKEGETSPFALARSTDCGTDTVPTVNKGNTGSTLRTFCAKMKSQQLVVKKNDYSIVLAKPHMKDNYAGGVAGETVMLYIDSGSVISTTKGPIRARGVDSSNQLSYNNGNNADAGEIVIGRSGISSSATAVNSNLPIVGTKNVSVLAKIASITDANPNTSLSQGSAFDLGVFKITAAPNGNSKNGSQNVALSGVIFTVNSTNVGLDNSKFYFYAGNDTANAINCKAYTSAGVLLPTTNKNQSGSFLVECQPITNSYNAQVAPGGSTNITLRAGVTQFPITTSTNYNVSVALDNYNNSTLAVYGLNSGNTLSHFEWLNKDDSNSTKFSWVDMSSPTSVQSKQFTN